MAINDKKNSYGDGYYAAGIGTFPDYRYGLIDSNGNVLIEPKWDSLWAGPSSQKTESE